MIKQMLGIIPEELQLGVGDWIFRNQLRLGRIILGARTDSANVLGVNTSYMEMGDSSKEAFLFIPGFSDLKESYLILCKLMSEKFHCIIVDVPGFGDSGRLEESYSIEFYADWLGEFVRKVGIDKFHFYGNSLGGAILGEFAYRYPTSILSLTFSCSAGIYIDSEESFFREYVEGKNLFLVDSEEEMERMFSRLFFKKPYIPYIVFQYFYLHYKRNRFHYSEIMDGLTRKFILEEEYKIVPDRYKSLNHKTLVVWGRHDSLFPVSFGRETASHIPGAVFSVIDDCGHLPHLESPFRLRDEIYSFLGIG